MTPFRLYLTGFLTGLITSIAFEVIKEAIAKYGVWPPATAGSWAIVLAIKDNWEILLLALVLPFIPAVGSLLILSKTESWFARRSFRKFDFFLHHLNDLNEAGSSLEKSIEREIKFFEKNKNLKNLRDIHQLEPIREAFSEALKKLIRTIPPEYEGMPSIRTASIMLRSNYLNGEIHQKSFDKLTPLAGDALEAVHYVDHLGLRPILYGTFRPLKFIDTQSTEGADTDGEAFALATVRGGNIKMGPTRPKYSFMRKFPFVRQIRPFIAFGDADREKKSIINIPLTNKNHESIGVISIDSSQLQFTGNSISIVYLKNIFSNFIHSMEKSLFLLENTPAMSRNQDITYLAWRDYKTSISLKP